MVAHTCNPRAQDVMQEENNFEARKTMMCGKFRMHSMFSAALNYRVPISKNFF